MFSSPRNHEFSLSMDSLKTRFIIALLVFKNTINEELIRSLHVYQSEDGRENEVEREYLFSKRGSYTEMVAHPLLRLQRFKVSDVIQGQVNGLWLCIYAFHADHSLSHPTHIPSSLLISGNPKLQSIPTLANDLQMILQFRSSLGNENASESSSQEMGQEKGDTNLTSIRSVHVLDLNCFPYPLAAPEYFENHEIDQTASGVEVKRQKKRAASEDVAKLSLEDLVKYFDLPIVEASRSLKVGLTVLKRKCREFGIPRWPHRKIKSLDTLIHDLEEEAQRQQQENEAAAKAAAKRQSMLEDEKANIEKKPFMEIQRETKRFRQDVFKRRHRARAIQNREQSISPSSNSNIG